MIEKLTKKQSQYYQVTFVILMLSILGTIFYFWKLGFIDGSRGKLLHKASFIVEGFDETKPLNEIETVVFNENPKMAIQKIEALEKEFEKVHNSIENDTYDNAKSDLQRLKTSVANLISFPKTNKVISVFNDKMDKFQSYVEEKKWRTLTRSSNRILTVTKGHINKKKLPQLISSVEKSFDYMEKITENSLLSRPEKSEITSRIANLKIEMEMMKKYLEERKFFSDLLVGVRKSVSTWISTVGPELAYQKLQVEQIGRYYIMGLFGILGLTSIFFMTSFFVNKLHNKKAQGQLEEQFETIISEGMLNQRPVEIDGFSVNFNKYVDQNTIYINKRMSFGSIFQEALPLASIMLDKNLKVIWANGQFCDDWEVSEEEINKEYLTWDYLSKLTNIGVDDPVLEGLKHKVAGIYQIQVKPNENSEVRPYEMFVSPVKYNNDSRIMLFFYPLMSLQQTISDQARSIVNPIRKTLELLVEEKYSQADHEQLRKEFEIAEISEVLDSFDDLYAKSSNEKSNLFDEIEMLHTKVDGLLNIVDEVERSNFSIHDENKGQIEDLKHIKDNIINLSENSKENEKVNQDQLASIKLLNKGYESLLNKSGGLTSLVDEMIHSIPSFNKLKEELKQYKQELGESKMRFSHNLAQLIHVKKKIDDEGALERFNNTYSRLSSEYKTLDQVSLEIERRIMQIEVVLSKTQLILNGANERLGQYSTSAETKLFNDEAILMKEYAEFIQSTSGKTHEVEDQLVRTLHSLYLHTKGNIKSSRFIADRVSRRASLEDYYDSEISTDALPLQNEGSDSIETQV